MEDQITTILEARENVLSWLSCGAEDSLSDLTAKISDIKFIRDEYLVKKELDEKEVYSLYLLTRIADAMEEVRLFKSRSQK